jgi:pentose-5-phosphate-3-epimerase
MPLSSIKELLPHLSLVCIMTVNPGYAGQKLMPNTLAEIRSLADLVAARGLDIEIEVNGNVNWDNIPRMLEAGSQAFVAGSSSLFGGKACLRDNLRGMRALVGRTGSGGAVHEA